VWDAGCGSGQASVRLARVFDNVIATDPSADQIAAAPARADIEYRVEAAERCGLADASVNLVNVSQALHWFDVNAFYAQVSRVLVPGGLLAVSGYGNCRVSPAVDVIETRLYTEIVGRYWPPERALVDDGYRSLPFPFQRIPTPSFVMQARWTLPRFLDYLRSWSATQRYIKAVGQDPVTAITGELTEAWEDPSLPRLVRWPFFVMVGKAH